MEPSRGELLIARRIASRIRDENLNALVGFFGLPGKGKSYADFRIHELVADELGLPFGTDNIHFSVRDLMHHVNQRPIAGTGIVLDDAETDANSQKWWTDAAYHLSLFGGTGRYRRLFVSVTAPWSDWLTRQFRSLFHLTFDIKRIDRDACQVIAAPKVPYRDNRGKPGERYLRVDLPNGGHVRMTRVHISLPSRATGPFHTWPEYEGKKDRHMTPFYERIEDELGGSSQARPWAVKAIQLLVESHPDWTQSDIGKAIGLSREHVNRLLAREKGE